MSELKPCPLCGETIVIIESRYEKWTFVCCRNCGCSSGYKPTETEAIAAWNTRADQTAKKVYRAGDVVPDGYYWANFENKLIGWVTGRVIKMQFQSDIPGISSFLDKFRGCLIPIDPPEGVDPDE